MSRNDQSSRPALGFPRVELSVAERVRIREVLLREVISATPQKAPRFARARFAGAGLTRARLAIPIVALAVVLAIVGSTIVAKQLNGSAAPEPANTTDPIVIPPPDVTQELSPQDSDAQCVSSGRAISLKQGKDLLYLGPTPTGYRKPAYILEDGNSCYMGRDLIASYYHLTPGAPSGTFDAAVTIGHLADSPEKVAKWPNVSWRDSDQTGLPTSDAVNVKVGSRPGKLSDGRLLTWKAPDGGYWSMTGSGLTGDQLISIGAGLKLKGSKVSWPKAVAQGFTRLDIPAQPRLKDSRDRFFEVTYGKKNCKGCQLTLDVSPDTEQDQHPWQAQLGLMLLPARLVTVDGRPGVLSERGLIQEQGKVPGHELRTLTADGDNVWVIEETTQARTDLVSWAQGITKITPDDPRLAGANSDG